MEKHPKAEGQLLPRPITSNASLIAGSRRATHDGFLTTQFRSTRRHREPWTGQSVSVKMQMQVDGFRLCIPLLTLCISTSIRNKLGLASHHPAGLFLAFTRDPFGPEVCQKEQCRRLLVENAV